MGEIDGGAHTQVRGRPELAALEVTALVHGGDGAQQLGGLEVVDGLDGGELPLGEAVSLDDKDVLQTQKGRPEQQALGGYPVHVACRESEQDVTARVCLDPARAKGGVYPCGLARVVRDRYEVRVEVLGGGKQLRVSAAWRRKVADEQEGVRVLGALVDNLRQ